MVDHELIENWNRYLQTQVMVLKSIDDRLRSIQQLLVRLDIAAEAAIVASKKACTSEPAVNAKRPPRNRRSKGAATTVQLDGQRTVDQAIDEVGFEQTIGDVATELV